MAKLLDCDPLFVPEQLVWAGGLPGKIVGHRYYPPAPYEYLVQFEDGTRALVGEDAITNRFLH